MTLLNKLLTAEHVCRDCGDKYGKYSVGCSSHWQGQCDVCDEHKPVTEVRDWGYLTKGIKELKGEVKEQSKKVADYVLSVGPIMNDDELEDALTPSYEDGEITLKLTEEEVDFLNSWLDKVNDLSGPEEVGVWETVSQKVYELYNDYCVKYELSPALIAYYSKYGTWGSENDEEVKRWEGFRDAFVMLQEKNV